MSVEFKSDEEKISYALGLNFAMQMTQFPVDVDVQMFIDGFRSVMEDGKPGMDREEFHKALDLLQERINAAEAEHGHCHCGGDCGGDCGGSCGCSCNGAENRKNGDAYREKNASSEGVQVMPSGLQIKHIQAGTGASPKASDRVRVHYTGKLIDGTVFDSSVDRGQPIDFPLNGVIAGWTEGLQLMNEGGKAELTIPPELGYGEQGAGNVIPPQATLIFEVELIKVL